MCQSLAVDRSVGGMMKAAAGSQTSKRHWDVSSLISLPGSCSLDGCPHFIRCRDIKSMKKNCNKHLKESQEWRQIDLDRFQCICPVAFSDTCSNPVEAAEKDTNSQRHLLQMLLKYVCDLSIQNVLTTCCEFKKKIHPEHCQRDAARAS